MAIVLVAAALSGASLVSVRAISDHIEHRQRIDADAALARLALRQAQGRRRCRDDDRCMLAVLFPDHEGGR
jgi:hypothetical protein